MVTHGENSPSLCPTISSVTVNSWYTCPLCTWNLRPTKLGRIVAARAWVLIGGGFSPGLVRTMGKGTMFGPGFSVLVYGVAIVGPPAFGSPSPICSYLSIWSV
jgi:hypothetical protein